SVADVLHKPLCWKWVTQSFGLGQFIGLGAYGGEMKPLGPLDIEECDFSVAGPPRPTARHEVGDGSNVGVVYFSCRGGRDASLLFIRSGAIG
ncbi:MAG: hypothetical protein O6948_07945, partial [Deltaproteobacteria bacterium]|nr:hypothetical protein [Deltaproteobacteria bacterium]